MVERNLAKVEVASSSLVSRSRFSSAAPGPSPGALRFWGSQVMLGAAASWRSGYATVCKTVYAGSIPADASNRKSSDEPLAAAFSGMASVLVAVTGVEPVRLFVGKF